MTHTDITDEVPADGRSTRERKLKFFTDFDRSALEDAVCRYLAKHGPDFLSDDFLDDLVSIEVRRRRADQHRMLRNRPILLAAAGLGLASALSGMLSKETA